MAINREDWLRSVVPSGTVIAFAGAVAPSGWLLCNGSAISRTTYSALFTAIGSAHGSGDGSTTFHLPDYRGRFLRGLANGSTNDPDRASRTSANAGGNSGDTVGSVQADAAQSHYHNIPNNTIAGSMSSVFTRSNIVSATGGQISWAAYTSNLGTSSDQNGNTSTESRPKNANVNYIIKV